jgi:exosortase A-associated hydrolase 2
MNKSRRMVTLVGSALADAGVTVVLPDLTGTGDSCGDFVDGDWSSWRDDLVRVSRWCEAAGTPVTALLGVRLGCALACDAEVLAALPAVTRTVFWQPALDGARHLVQFMRLRVAAAMANDVRESVAGLREELARDGEIEVAGYRISSALAAQLDAVKEPLVLPARLGTVDWFELVRQDGQPVSPAATRLVDASRSAGREVRAHAVAGEPFWAATEIVTHAELVRRTCDALACGATAPPEGAA